MVHTRRLNLLLSHINASSTVTSEPSNSHERPRSSLSKQLEAYRATFKDPDYFQGRNDTFEHLKAHKDVYVMPTDCPTSEYRAAVDKQAKLFATSGIITVERVASNLQYFLGVMDALNCYDICLVARLVIHYQLFGTCLLTLGTERHRRFIRDVNSMRDVCFFAMTEIAHGSNVRAVKTTATYDPNTKEFVIHTPSPDALKFWIGNSAVYGTLGVIFARLITQGKDYGVHAFVARIRDPDTMELVRGVELKDVGKKLGWNGIDNGIFRFTQFRIPRENLLNKYADVAEDGTYSSQIASEGARFGATLAALVLGRVLYSAGPTQAFEMALTTTTRYALQRRQFGPNLNEESLIIDYASYKNALFPMIAKNYAFYFTWTHYAKLYSNANGVDNKFHAEISGVKALITEYVPLALAEMRVMCGGHGFAYYNQIGPMRDEFDVFQTAEGDSTVLYQQLAKYLLTLYKKRYASRIGAAKLLLEGLYSFVFERNVIQRNWFTEKHMLSTAMYLEAFSFRAATLLHRAAMTLQRNLTRHSRKSDSRDAAFFSAWSDTLVEILAASKAYVHLIMLQRFVSAVRNCTDNETKATLLLLCRIYALDSIQSDMGFFAPSKYIGYFKESAVRDTLDSLYTALRPKVLSVVEAYSSNEELVRPPIGLSNMQYVANILKHQNAHQFLEGYSK